MLASFLVFVGLICGQMSANTLGEESDLFDIDAIRDDSTLDIEVLQDWHVDMVNGTTRQKLIEVTVAEWWPGFDYRVPVRFIVPLNGKAKGFHITGEHIAEALEEDAILDDLDAKLIAGGVGVVCTVVKPLKESPGGEEMEKVVLELLAEMREQ